jgi:hypothetical protein
VSTGTMASAAVAALAVLSISRRVGFFMQRSLKTVVTFGCHYCEL